MVYSYACSDCPGMGNCGGRFYTDTEEELWRLMELHAVLAHGENPAEWTPEERATLSALIRRESRSAPPHEVPSPVH